MTAPNPNPGGFNGGSQHTTEQVRREQIRAAVTVPLQEKIRAQLAETYK